MTVSPRTLAATLADASKAEKVEIVVQQGGRLGGTPTVRIKTVTLGFDWDSGKVLLFPEKPLTVLPMETVQEIQEFKTKQMGYESFREWQALKARISELEATAARLQENPNA